MHKLEKVFLPCYEPEIPIYRDEHFKLWNCTCLSRSRSRSSATPPSLLVTTWTWLIKTLTDLTLKCYLDLHSLLRSTRYRDNQSPNQTHPPLNHHSISEELPQLTSVLLVNQLIRWLQNFASFFMKTARNFNQNPSTGTAMEAAIFLCVNIRLRHQNRVYGEAVC